MNTAHAPTLRILPLTLRLLLVALAGLALARTASAQERAAKQATDEDEDVVRVETELVQTDVTVLDKQGRFVDGLRPEQFELRVGERVRPVSFFERVAAGSAAEEKQLAARRGGGSPSVEARTATADAPGRGRLLFFFVDDVHLAPENIARVRRALLRFVEGGMNDGDRLAVVSTSGRVGFLQQLTDDKTVLREAVARLESRRNPEVNAGTTAVSEYDASQLEAGNRELFRYLVQAVGKLGYTNPAGNVLTRSRQVGATARADATSTLDMLGGLLRSSAPLPGRKIVFFVSDGFVADVRNSAVLDLLQRVTKAAARVGAVIYTMDARGTFADASVDASQNPYPDFTGSVSRNIFAEAAGTQEPLRILADETGGRAILNSNSFEDGIRRALAESSDYYLLAWRPERGEGAGAKARVAVSIKGRPDLKVRVRRGFLEAPPAASEHKKAAGKSAEPSAPEADLLAALGSVYPVRALPVALSVGYLNAPGRGAVLTASMQMEADALREGGPVEGQKTEVDVMGAAVNDRGSIVSFKQKLTFPVAATGKPQESIVWNQQLTLSPGLYQVRVAVRDRRTGRTGSAMQWVEIPTLAPDKLSMSTIFIGGRRAEDAASPAKVPVSVTRRLGRGSRLRYQTYVYNAARAAGAPDVAVQVQILHNGQPVLSLPQTALTADAATDPARLSFSGEVALGELPPGRYVLRISATDRASQKTASQQTDFIVE